MYKTITLSFAAVLLGGLLLWQTTHGLRVFTAEGERRASVEREPRGVPGVTLVDMSGRRFQFPGPDANPMLVEFIYTRCPTICTQLGETFARLVPKIANRNVDARLISVSFDPVHDDAEAMQGYAELHGADGRRWNIARPESREDLEKLIETFGVTVIPDRFGGFEHNAAIHYVDGTGQLAGIYGLEQDGEILDQVGVLQ